MWTYEDEKKENYTLRKKFKDDVLKMYELIADTGYKMHLIGDEGYTDEEGNYFPPEYSEKVYLPVNANYNLYEAVEIALDNK